LEQLCPVVVSKFSRLKKAGSQNFTAACFDISYSFCDSLQRVWQRIHIEFGQLDPDPGGKKEKSEELYCIVLKCCMVSFLRTGDFSCGLDDLHAWRPRAKYNIMQFFYLKMCFFISEILQFLVMKFLDPDPDQHRSEILDPDPH
jgi:hypothetical protein